MRGEGEGNEFYSVVREILAEISEVLYYLWFDSCFRVILNNVLRKARSFYQIQHAAARGDWSIKSYICTRQREIYRPQDCVYKPMIINLE